MKCDSRIRKVAGYYFVDIRAIERYSKPIRMFLPGGGDRERGSEPPGQDVMFAADAYSPRRSALRNRTGAYAPHSEPQQKSGLLRLMLRGPGNKLSTNAGRQCAHGVKIRSFRVRMTRITRSSLLHVESYPRQASFKCLLPRRRHSCRLIN
jgi:hypothetical protein